MQFLKRSKRVSLAPLLLRYTIEFQKCGLPHMHILIFLDGQWKLFNPEQIDSIIQAHWPDPITQPVLFETVKRCMVHGRCTKGFPKPFCNQTRLTENGYPEYYRPDVHHSNISSNIFTKALTILLLILMMKFHNIFIAIVFHHQKLIGIFIESDTHG